jgi:cytochrome c5
MRWRLLLGLVAAAALSCGDKIDAVQESAGACPGAVTYELDIRPILESLCVGCHDSTLSGAARNGAPVSADFDSFAGALRKTDPPWTTRLRNETMPPGGTKASAAQKQLVQCWVEGGKQEKP